MSADTTLIAVDDTPYYRAIAEYRTDLRYFPDDELLYAGDGVTLVGYREGSLRWAFDHMFHDRTLVDFDWFEVGPTYWGHRPDEAYTRLEAYWAEPHVVTPVRIATSMVVLNGYDGPYRRYWNRRVTDEGKRGRRYRYELRESQRRVARVQNVKRWFWRQLGRICWAEAW